MAHLIQRRWSTIEASDECRCWKNLIICCHCARHDTDTIAHQCQVLLPLLLLGVWATILMCLPTGTSYFIISPIYAYTYITCSFTSTPHNFLSGKIELQMATLPKLFLLTLAIASLADYSHAGRATLSFENQPRGWAGWEGNDADAYFPFYDRTGNWVGGGYRPGDSFWFGRGGGFGYSRGGDQQGAGGRLGWTFRYGRGYIPGSGDGDYWWNTGRSYRGSSSSWADSTSTGNGYGSGFGYGYGGGKHSSSYSSSGGGQFDGQRTAQYEAEDHVATNKPYAGFKDGTGSKVGSNKGHTP